MTTKKCKIKKINKPEEEIQQNFTLDGYKGIIFRLLHELEDTVKRRENLASSLEYLAKDGHAARELLRLAGEEYLTFCNGYLEREENTQLTLRMSDKMYAFGPNNERIEIGSGEFEMPGVGKMNLGELVTCVDDFKRLIELNATKEIDRMISNIEKNQKSHSNYSSYKTDS